MTNKEVSILLVEDDDGDFKLVQRAFRKAGIANQLIRAIDGVDALEMLNGTHGKMSIKRPYMLMVDINMPRMNGLNLVRTIREDPKLKDTIVFMLTTSKHDEDKQTAYNLNVAGYILKENAGHDFLELIGLIGGYSRIVEMP
jgi:CheY-like chemotaxis protein